MRLIFKQRFFSWFDSYDIYDEAGNVVYTVEGKLSWGHCLHILNSAGEHTGTVQERVLTFLPKFEMYIGEQYVGCIQKEFTFFTPRFDIDCNGWQVEGSFMEWDYAVTEPCGALVAQISKELFNWTDTYVIDVTDPGNALCVLMLVLAIDAEYGILLVRVAGDGYRGVLAICRYPELLRLEMAVNYGAEGELAGSIASDHGGILAMNANGFLDPEGMGNGGQLAGWCMSNGEGHGEHFSGEAYQRIELSESGLDCRIVPASDPVGEGTYSAAEFMPALIRDGEKLENQDWTGEQPRACFGAGDQGICMLVIEGRYPDEGIRGTSVNTCADILLAYGCRNAINMDGGSSAILWYDGEYVTQSSSVTLRYTGGRPLPNAWVYG